MIRSVAGLNPCSPSPPSESTSGTRVQCLTNCATLTPTYHMSTTKEQKITEILTVSQEMTLSGVTKTFIKALSVQTMIYNSEDTESSEYYYIKNDNCVCLSW